MESGTFAIVGRDGATGRLGVAVAAALPAVGAFCPAARAGVGALSVQGQVAPPLRRRIMDLLAEGKGAEEAAARIWESDGGREGRQILVVDRSGGAAALTGEGVGGFAGHLTAADCAVGGGHLASLDVLEAMSAAFAGAPAQDLPERLLRALEAGRREGGDSRGERSAAIRVVDRDGYPYLDLRVDDQPRAVDELRRLADLQAERFLPGYAAWVEALAREGG